MAKTDKTNVMRVLEQKKIEYVPHLYDADPTLSGAEIARMLDEPCEKVFKTLVTVGASKTYYVFVVPVEKELNLKKAASFVGEKKIEMVKAKDLLGLTGYVHGGCSPIGMKKFFKTTFDESAKDLDEIMFSGGKVGFQVQVAMKDVSKVINFRFADIVAD